MVPVLHATAVHKILTSLLAAMALLLAPASSLGAQPKDYWLVSSTGQVFAYGKAKTHGSEYRKHYWGVIKGIKATPDHKGQGYWIVTTKAHYDFGDAGHYKYRPGGSKKYTGKIKPKGLKGKIVGYAVASIPASGGAGGGPTTTPTGTTTAPTGTTTPPTSSTPAPLTTTPSTTTPMPTQTTTTPTTTTSTTVDCSSTAIQTNTLNSATATDAYSQTLTAGGISGGSWSWTIQSGSLPDGLSLSNAGTIAGTPAQSTAGTQSSFTVQATNSQCPGSPASKAFTLTVGAPPMSITTNSLPSGTYGDAYTTTQLQVTGGQPGDYQWSASGWQWSSTGLSLSTSGVLSGTVENAGTYNVTFTVVDSTGATPSVSVTIPITLSFPPLQITGPSSISNGQATVAYSTTTFTATGGSEMAQPQQYQAGDYEWSATDLPPGLSMSVHGVLSGTPTQPGTYDPKVTVTDFENAVPPVTVSYPMTVADPPLKFTTTTLTAIQGQSYTGHIVVQGGEPPYTMYRLAGSLPTGMTFNNGVITVNSTVAAGDYQFTIGVTDSQSSPATAQETFNMWVAPSQTAPDLNVTGTDTESPWAGYLEQSSSAFTSVSGTFTVPTVQGSPANSVSPWVGIDGYGTTAILQAGVTALGGNGATSYMAWWDMVSPRDEFEASPGDVINVNIWELSAGQWEVTLNDTMSGHGFATQVSYSGPGTTAEWIVETPAGSAATGYTASSTFTNLQASQSGTGMLEEPSTGVAVSNLSASGFSISDDN